VTNETWGNNQKAFQTAIREVRKKAGLTQVQLSKLICKPQSYVSKYESGERRLDFIETVAVCESCSITIGNFNRIYKKNL